jgi:hypothetical protein
MNNSIIFTECTLLSDIQMEQMEKSLSIQFPKEIYDFIQIKSNGVPKIQQKNCTYSYQFEDGWKYELSIEKIIDFESITKLFDDDEMLERYIKDQNLTKDFVEIEHLCPFAYAPNGVFYISVSGKHNGKVYFADNGDFGILFLTNSFENFWDSVYDG